jgi:hypothetical protein
VVSVPRRDKAKRLTLIVPYYQNGHFFQMQAAMWRAYDEDLLAHLSIIVVDDGSPVPATKPIGLPNLRLFRIEDDVRWNWLAARNIGAHHADDGWLLLTDMDHVVTVHTLRSVLYGEHDPDVVYVFSRREHTGTAVPPHSASFMMTRQMFWRIGGYDEALSGYYGTDGEFRRRVVREAKIHVLRDVLTRYEYVDDSSTTTYQRKQPEDAAVRKLVAARGPHWTPKTLSFPYHEVAA